MNITSTHIHTPTSTERPLRLDHTRAPSPRPLPKTWQACHEELARHDIDPAWRAQVEQRLETICRGTW